jgi:hypothetical protein
MCGARRAAKAAPHDERGARGGAPCTHTRAHQGCAPDLGAAGVCTSPRSSIDTLGAGLFIISAVRLCNSRPGNSMLVILVVMLVEGVFLVSE